MGRRMMPNHLHDRLSIQRGMTEINKSRASEGSLFLYAVSGLQKFVYY